MKRQHEPLNNIGIVCAGCMDERKTETQGKINSIHDLIGKYVKKGFKVGKGIEHMWVKVTSVTDDGVLIGVLDNDPCMAKLRCGDHVKVMREEIEEVC